MAYPGRRLSWRGNAMYTGKFSIPEFQTVESYQMWDHGSIGAPQTIFYSQQPQCQYFLYSFISRGYAHLLVSSENLLIMLTSLISSHLQHSPALSGTSSLHLMGESYMFGTTQANGQRHAVQLSSTAFSAMSRSKSKAATLRQSAYPCSSWQRRTRTDLLITETSERCILSR